MARIAGVDLPAKKRAEIGICRSSGRGPSADQAGVRGRGEAARGRGGIAGGGYKNVHRLDE